jgi:hypothetical protein
MPEVKTVETSEVEEWRRHVAELREVADREADPARRMRLWQLADRWDRFAAELAEAERNAVRRPLSPRSTIA